MWNAVWAGSVLHLFYTALFCRFNVLYWWYYLPPVMLLAGSVSVLDLLRRPWVRYAAWAGVGVFILLTVCFRWNDSKATLATHSPAAQMIAYMNEHGIVGKTILISDLPGFFAFYSANRFLAADMLTCNRDFYARMRASGHALGFMREYCAATGCPLEYYLYTGGVCFRVNLEDDRLVRAIYFDPHALPKRVELGHMLFERGGHEYASAYNCILWCCADMR